MYFETGWNSLVVFWDERSCCPALPLPLSPLDCTVMFHQYINFPTFIFHMEDRGWDERVWCRHILKIVKRNQFLPQVPQSCFSSSFNLLCLKISQICLYMKYLQFLYWLYLFENIFPSPAKPEGVNGVVTRVALALAPFMLHFNSISIVFAINAFF